MTKQFGKEIRSIRKDRGETLVQTADAIGIDRSHLTKIELGQDRPTERIVQSLFAHFSIERVKASRLWSLAGFTSEMVTAEDYRGKEDTKMKDQSISVAPPAMANINLDPTKPTHYTDSIFLNSSDFGLVVDFARRVGPEQHFVVTSVGMSFDHAKKLVEVLNDELEKHER
jgi:transcriptional regulator with XRE-family HTH domain